MQALLNSLWLSSSPESPKSAVYPEVEGFVMLPGGAKCVDQLRDAMIEVKLEPRPVNADGFTIIPSAKELADATADFAADLAAAFASEAEFEKPESREHFAGLMKSGLRAIMSDPNAEYLLKAAVAYCHQSRADALDQLLGAAYLALSGNIAGALLALCGVVAGRLAYVALAELIETAMVACDAKPRAPALKN